MRMVAGSMVLVLFGVVGCATEVSEPLDESAEAVATQRLRYTQVNITAGPANEDGWFPRGLTEDGEVIGQAFDCNEDFTICTQDVVKRRRNGQFSVLEEDFVANDVNNRGDAGGCTSKPGFENQAGIVRENGKLELIPRLPGELSSCVSNVSDSGVAFVASSDANFVVSVYVFDKGRILPFPVLDVTVVDINDKAELTGTQFSPDVRAYRFDARTQTTTLLQPVPPDPASTSFDINRQGEVLGTSFDFDGTVQRIGKWNRQNEFETSLVATPDFIANSVAWNEQHLIVVSATTDENTYLVPSPGVLINLAELVRNPPVAPALTVLAMNRRADLIAFSQDGAVYLYRRD